MAGKGHGKAVDWWSVGILLYEMLCGTPPFRAKGRAQLQRQILTAKLKLPRTPLAFLIETLSDSVMVSSLLLELQHTFLVPAQFCSRSAT